MTPPYRLYGAALSPYSIKVRSYLRYKGVDHAWLERSAARAGEFSRYAKLPLIPVLVDAAEEVLQDSTPMIAALEAEHPEPVITPDDPICAFLSALLEDYADEWVNKQMFHFRWAHEADQLSAAKRIVDGMLDGETVEDRRPIEAQVRERMVGRLNMVGSNAQTGPVIEASFRRLADLLEAHLSGRAYLFGGRPSLADFGLAAQLHQLLSDPTPGGVLRAHHPHVVGWIERMLEPAAHGPFETWAALEATLEPLLRAEIVGVYLPWMAANSDAVYTRSTSLSVELDGVFYTQEPQRYAGKAFSEIRRRFAAAGPADPALMALMTALGAEPYLRQPGKKAGLAAESADAIEPEAPIAAETAEGEAPDASDAPDPPEIHEPRETTAD